MPGEYALLRVSAPNRDLQGAGQLVILAASVADVILQVSDAPDQQPQRVAKVVDQPFLFDGVIPSVANSGHMGIGGITLAKNLKKAE